MEGILIALTKIMVIFLAITFIEVFVLVIAGVLIIWDRIFGTFAPESEKVVYGLVHPLNSWNPMWAQLHHAFYIITNIGSQKGLVNKLSFLLKGPGWSPGKPRLGNIEDIPQVRSLLLALTTNSHYYDNYRCLLMKSDMIVQVHFG